MEKNLFEIAVRNRYRFPYKGMVSVEDLWDLSVGDLDSIFKTLNRQKKASDEDSLLVAKTSEDSVLANKIDIVKYIVSVKLEEAERHRAEAENRIQREKILRIMAKKQDAALEDMDMNQLEAELAKLS